MSFSYDPTLADSISQIRFRVGDTVENAGALPNDVNISNEELTALISFEGSWQRATAAAFEKLHSEWTKKANFSASGGGQSQSWQYQSIVDGFYKQAKEWRSRYGSVGDDQDPDSGETAPSIQIGAIGMGDMETW